MGITVARMMIVVVESPPPLSGVGVGVGVGVLEPPLVVTEEAVTGMFATLPPVLRRF